jgi:peptide/nickel transport system permease protein
MSSIVASKQSPLRSPGALLAALWLITLVVSAIGYRVLPFQNPDESDFEFIGTGPNAAHWLGTDEIGRDLLARAVAAAQISLYVGFVAVAIAAVIGGTLGLCAGYFKGRIDNYIMGANDVLLAFPGLIMALALVAVLGSSARNVTIALGLVMTPAFARVARAATLTYAARPFVMAAKSMGATHRQVIFGELASNVALSVLAYALTAVSTAILAEGALSFLGLSVPPPAATWGGMIVSGKDILAESPHVAFVPALFMFITVLSFNSLGEKFRKTLDGREGRL